MDGITIEKADYLIAHYHQLLSFEEKMALRHHRSSLKLGEDVKDVRLTRIYLKTGWLSDDPLILNYLNDGYIQFMLNCAQRILTDYPDEVFFNLCPNCGKLARTPLAKQCRFCGLDWH